MASCHWPLLEKGGKSLFRPSRYNWSVDLKVPSRRIGFLTGHYWKKVGNLSVSDLEQFIDSPARLWVDGFSSFERLNNRVPYSADNSIIDSLRLIVVRRLALSEFHDNRNRRRLTGHFRHARQDYTLDITDPLFLAKYAELPADSNITGERFLTVSLGEPFESYGHTYSYKLIATVIEP